MKIVHRNIALSLIALMALHPIPALSAEIPAAALKIPPMVKEESVSTYVPSEAAPGQGLAVNLIYSSKPRYKDGAPVLVVVPGGNGGQGLDFSMHAAQQGFVELRFAFPGGGKPGFSSSGIYDNRGIKSQEALRDVMRFAAGEIADSQGKKVADLLPIRVSNKTIGAVGWSNGGNTLLVTLGKFGEKLPFVAWIVFYESPVGSMFYPPSLGGAQDFLLNKHYRQGTAATGQVVVDFRKLGYQKDASKAPGAHKKSDEPEIKGVAFFDENDNGVWDETSEFAFPYSTDIGIEKQIYPPQVTKVLTQLPQFAPPKPTKEQIREKKKVEPPKLPFVNYDESLAYFRERDGSLYVRDVVRQFPEMAFTVFGSHLDHLQRQPDHPHIALLYNTLLEQKPKFLRLNPCSIYVGQAGFMKPSTFVENKPNTSIESDAIDQYLEPEGLIPVYVFIDAACAELADRIHTGKWNKVLEEPLVNYSNGAKPPDEPASRAKVTTGKSESGKEPSDKAALPAGSAKEPASTRRGQPEKSAGTGDKAPKESSPKDWPFAKPAAPAKK